MGNPAPQPRSNSPKTYVKPKHRHSGSVSSISFAPEDLKPKHRPSGSLSNISITPPAPEELKELKPKHRRSGSVSSSININADDFFSPIRGNASRSSSPSSSVPSSSSTSSLKEKRNKRRTRSSLGGTEDFVKELDFLTTPLPSGRTPESTSTRKELLKTSPSSPLPEPAPLQAPAESLAPVPEASVPVLEDGFGESPAPIEQEKDLVVENANAGENGGFSRVEKSLNSADDGDIVGSPPHGQKFACSANVIENGGSPHDEKSVSSTQRDIVHTHDASQSTESESNGVDSGSADTLETIRDERHPEMDGEGDHEGIDKTLSTLENGSNAVAHEVSGEILPSVQTGHHPETAAGLPLVGTVTPEFDHGEQVDVWKQAQAKKAPVLIDERGLPSESVEAATAGTRIASNTSEQEGFTESDNRESSVAGGTTKPLTNGDCQVSPCKEEELSQEEQAAKDTQEEEKVSVQKRIEELEKIAGGRPVHFRSQSLSIPRPFEVSHARHHEAEASKGLRMPAYKAPLDITSVSELCDSALEGTCLEELAEEGSLQLEGSASTVGTSSITGPDVDETSAQEIEPQEVPVFNDGHKAVDVSPDTTMNGVHLENGRTPESLEVVPANKAESMAKAEAIEVAEAHSNTTEQKEVEIGKEERAESGLGEVSVPVAADSVPQELHSQTPADPTKEYGGKLETVEPPPGALKSGKTLEAHQLNTVPEAAKTGMLPVARQRGTFSKLPSVQASMAEQSSLDYVSTMLLTKKAAVDPLFIDSPQDHLWEMYSQELTIGESSGQDVRESSAQEDDPRQYHNGTPTHAEVTPSGSAVNGNAQSNKSSKVDRPRTPLRSLLADEDAETGPDSGQLGTPPQNQSVSPRGNLFKRIVSGGKNSPTKQTTPSKFSPKNQTAAKPFLSSCICCSVK